WRCEGGHKKLLLWIRTERAFAGDGSTGIAQSLYIGRLLRLLRLLRSLKQPCRCHSQRSRAKMNCLQSGRLRQLLKPLLAALEHIAVKGSLLLLTPDHTHRVNHESDDRA